MGSNPWDGIISDEDLRAYEAAGFGRPSGMGKRPALVIIDVQYRSVGSHPMPFHEAVKEYPTSCGEVGWAAVGHIAELLGEFRRRGWPVLYPHVAPKQAYDGGRLAEKVPGIMDIPARGYDFVAEIAPVPGDILIPKRHPSAFFGTALCSYLIDAGVDTIVVTGATTSGCVRGTVVDGFSYGFKCVAPIEAVYDRGAVSHAVNLFDLGQKYADVLPVAEVMAGLKAIP